MQTILTTPQRKLVEQERKTESPKRVLCVEDDRDTCEILRFVLKEYELTAVHSVEEAEKLIASTSFDLYVLDNWLPDGSGTELCQKIREAGLTEPIIFTSAIGQRHEIDRAVAAGADRYLVKPYEPETLIQTVKELLIDPNASRVEA
jgi:DNA-binding response OmpR family regulator